MAKNAQWNAVLSMSSCSSSASEGFYDNLALPVFHTRRASPRNFNYLDSGSCLDSMRGTAIDEWLQDYEKMAKQMKGSSLDPNQPGSREDPVTFSTSDSEDEEENVYPRSVGGAVATGREVVAVRASADDPLFTTKRPGPYVAKVRKDGKLRPYAINLNDVSFGTKIGEGHFGKVYLGTLYGQQVAVKHLRLHRERKNAVLFKKEVKIMRTLRHPNIVEFLGACFEPNRLAIVTEFMSNGSLDKLMETHWKATKEPWPIRRILTAMKDIARGLNWLQHKNIIHRDLKPGNILVDRHNTCKIADFGLSHIKKRKQRATRGFYGVCGTPCYMAPEILKGLRYGYKADVFSFGIIMCELLTGHYPFLSLDKDKQGDQAKNNFEQAIIIGINPPIPDSCPKMLKELILQCWDADPAMRPSVDTLCEALLDIEKRLLRQPPKNEVSLEAQTFIQGEQERAEGLQQLVLQQQLLLNKAKAELMREAKARFKAETAGTILLQSYQQQQRELAQLRLLCRRLVDKNDSQADTAINCHTALDKQAINNVMHRSTPAPLLSPQANCLNNTQHDMSQHATYLTQHDTHRDLHTHDPQHVHRDIRRLERQERRVRREQPTRRGGESERDGQSPAGIAPKVGGEGMSQAEQQQQAAFARYIAMFNHDATVLQRHTERISLEDREAFAKFVSMYHLDHPADFPAAESAASALVPCAAMPPMPGLVKAIANFSKKLSKTLSSQKGPVDKLDRIDRLDPPPSHDGASHMSDSLALQQAVISSTSSSSPSPLPPLQLNGDTGHIGELSPMSRILVHTPTNSHQPSLTLPSRRPAHQCTGKARGSETSLTVVTDRYGDVVSGQRCSSGSDYSQRSSEVR